jgi:2'-5' RNA ligase
MLVHGAILPPPSALEAVAEVVRSAAAGQNPAPVGGKGLLGRLARGRARDTDMGEAQDAMLDQVPVERLRLPITGFGNLTTHDANRVAEAISAAAVAWHAPTLRFAGGTALDFPGDWSVWAKLDGDVEALSVVARGIAECVQGLGFFVDRRQFRPMVSVATVTRATTGPSLERVVAALDAFQGEPWTAHISLTKETFIEGRTATTEYRRITLAL